MKREVGDEVEALWDEGGGRTKYRKARIQKVNEDGTYEVCFYANFPEASIKGAVGGATTATAESGV